MPNKVPSANTPRRNTLCPACGNLCYQREECVYCRTVAWMAAQGRPLPIPDPDSDRFGRETRVLAGQVGMVV